jgi:hypothetical protein
MVAVTVCPGRCRLCDKAAMLRDVIKHTSFSFLKLILKFEKCD